MAVIAIRGDDLVAPAQRRLHPDHGELAWVGGTDGAPGWRPVAAAEAVADGEELFPMFPVTYADAVRAGLDAAGTRARLLLVEHLLVLDHAEAAAVETALRSRGVVVLDTTYDAQVGLRVGVPAAQVASLVSVVAGLTAGRVVPEPAGQRWVDA